MTFGCLLLVFLWGFQARAATHTPPDLSSMAMAPSTWFVDMTQYAVAAHGSLNCEACHGTMVKNGVSHPDPMGGGSFRLQTKRKFDYQACQKCHKKSYERYLTGEHAQALIKEKNTGIPSKTGYAPTCGDCHAAHYGKAHLSRAQTGKIMTDTCGSCHVEQKKTFLANYHGKAAVNLGYDRSAFCTDCHGAHTTLSLKEQDAALKACRRCHEDASPEFADIIIHDSPKVSEKKNDTKKSSLPWVFGMRILVITLVVGVLAFFYMHTGVLMLRKLKEKLRRHK